MGKYLHRCFQEKQNLTSKSNVLNGVLQGAILGPMLFNLYLYELFSIDTSFILPTVWMISVLMKVVNTTMN